MIQVLELDKVNPLSNHALNISKTTIDILELPAPAVMSVEQVVHNAAISSPKHWRISALIRPPLGSKR